MRYRILPPPEMPIIRPQAPLLAWDIVDTIHGRMAYIRAVFERIARFSWLDTPVLPAGEHYISPDSQRV